MSRFSQGLARLALRAGLAQVGRGQAGGDFGWRSPLDERLWRRLERVSLTAKQPAGGGLGGEHRSRARASSADFVDYRPYQEGDDFRQIDWNVYSRLDQLYVKLTEARERLTVCLLIDCSASMQAGRPSKLDLARQIAAVIGYVVLARFDRLEVVRLAGRGTARGAWRGKQRFGDLLAELDGLEATAALDLGAELSEFRAHRGGQAILISDMLHADGYERALEALTRSGLACGVIQVLSPQELHPEPGGDVELEDLESGERVEVGLSSRAIEVYRARLADWCDGVKRCCTALGLRFLRVSSDEPVEQVALVGLRQAGFLR